MDFTNPLALVGTAWLADHLEDPRVRIVDATLFLPTSKRDARKEFGEHHIPGAVLFDIGDICAPDTDLPHMLPEGDLFEEKVGKLGVGMDDFVVAYDRRGNFCASARAWWMFRIFGHDQVAVLDGGLLKWMAENRPTQSGFAAPDARPMTVGPLRGALVRSLEDLRGNIDSGREQVVDVRGRTRFAGTGTEPRPGMRGGHIPGSISMPLPDLLGSEDDPTMPSAEAIEGALKAAGIEKGRPVVATCGSGVAAAVVALAMHLVGRDDCAVYDGSWTEWGGREDTPVETGP